MLVILKYIYIFVSNKHKQLETMKTQMTEKQADAILRENMIDARDMQREYELQGKNDLAWEFEQSALGLRKLLMYGTLEEKLKIANP